MHLQLNWYILSIVENVNYFRRQSINKLKSKILRQIGALHRTVHAIYDVKYEEANLHKNQFIFLTRICENRGISLKELSILLRADKTTTTKITQKLIKVGYVYKEQDDKDKRIYRLYPTDKALDIYDTLIEEENRLVDICFSGFTEEEKSMVYSLAYRMKANIKSDWYELKNYNKVNKPVF